MYVFLPWLCKIPCTVYVLCCCVGLGFPVLCMFFCHGCVRFPVLCMFCAVVLVWDSLCCVCFSAMVV